MGNVCSSQRTPLPVSKSLRVNSFHSICSEPGATACTFETPIQERLISSYESAWGLSCVLVLGRQSNQVKQRLWEAIQAEPEGLLKRVWTELNPWAAMLVYILLSPSDWSVKVSVLSSLYSKEDFSKGELCGLLTEIFEVSVLVTPAIVIQASQRLPDRQLGLATYQNILKTQKQAFIQSVGSVLMRKTPKISKAEFCERANQVKFVFQPSALRLHVLTRLVNENQG